MKTILLSTLFIGLALSLNAQTTETINIDWSFGSNPSSALEGDSNYPSRTIEIGDTVTWNWYASGSHNVNNLPGSTEVFQSAFMSMGGTFSYTFTLEGTNPYQCDPHPGSMNGVITVVAEGALSVEDFVKGPSFTISPNPAREYMNIELNPRIQNATLQVYDVLGKQIIDKQISDIDSNVNVSNWNNGIYIVRVTSGDLSETKRFVKQ